MEATYLSFQVKTEDIEIRFTPSELLRLKKGKRSILSPATKDF